MSVHTPVWLDACVVHVCVERAPLLTTSPLSPSSHPSNPLCSSSKYQELVKKSGKPAPAPVITLRRLDGDSTAAAAAAVPRGAPAEQHAVQPTEGGEGELPAARQDKHSVQHGPGYAVVPAVKKRGQARAPGEAAVEGVEQEGGEEDEEGSSSGWETASDEGEEGAGEVAGGAQQAQHESAGGGAGDEEVEGGEWEAWDVRRSLFDNHMSPSMEANLEYMWKRFGFFLPDAEFLSDPEGLLKYLVRGGVCVRALAECCERWGEGTWAWFRSCMGLQHVPPFSPPPTPPTHPPTHPPGVTCSVLQAAKLQ